ncbi:GGDEF domain-containing protein [Chelatococcus asaccharovorans]|uniref:diguanylate cyclase n=1 Tax=Chelatococcus asaccharovorans TaxID=28210 RepID=A0A2V3U1Q1_9HYPH|nr:diguanylate cyclase [Chelatococcus asaccharovorans]MBS7702457.1 diguanylate cyclase [Chelatococcus asaccharovorans]PXW56335.1 diguanylate cyclase [Chelatococcus asaccharovorans]
MKLDFTTLYVVVLLNSLMLSIIWGSIAGTYRNFLPARYWLASSLINTVGGSVLLHTSGDYAILAAIAGNALIIFGFLNIWMGLRIFFGLSSGIGIAVAVTTVCAALMVLLIDAPRARNMVYSGGQLVPMVLSILLLAGQKSLGVGGIITMAAMGIGALSRLIVIGSNIAVLAQAFTAGGFFSIAPVTLLLVICSGIVWNFGLATMAIDRLREEVAILAASDDLTSLANRRGLNERLSLAMRRARRSGQTFAVMLVDLDNLKQINDSLGHSAGDAAIIHTAELIRAVMSQQDYAARLGGDEFCVIIAKPHASAPGADAASLSRPAQMADALLERLATTPLRFAGTTHPISASIGIAAWRPRDHEHHADILAEADAALYASKTAGRNTVTMAIPAAIDTTGAPVLGSGA